MVRKLGSIVAFGIVITAALLAMVSMVAPNTLTLHIHTTQRCTTPAGWPI